MAFILSLFFHLCDFRSFCMCFDYFFVVFANNGSSQIFLSSLK